MSDMIEEPLFYDRQGKPLAMMEWAEIRTDEYVRVAEDTIGKYWVSTVWLGVDHSFMPGSKPVIFETMIFDKENGGTASMDEFMWRYCTEEDALKGHQDAVTLAKLDQELEVD